MKTDISNAHYEEEMKKLEKGELAFFGSSASMMSRYLTYLKHTSFKDKRVLDIGAGPGIFYEYLLSEDQKPKFYLGTELLDSATRYSNEKFGKNHGSEFVMVTEDLLKMDITRHQKFDIVMSCGLFALRVGTQRETQNLWEDYIEEMYNSLEEGGILMNSNLSVYKGEYHDNEFVMYPDEVLKFALKLSERVEIDYSYAKHDFMLIMHKGPNLYKQIAGKK